MRDGVEHSLIQGKFVVLDLSTRSLDRWIVLRLTKNEMKAGKYKCFTQGIWVQMISLAYDLQV